MLVILYILTWPFEAFDSIPHKRLVSKLQGCGVSGKPLDWIENFFIGRLF